MAFTPIQQAITNNCFNNLCLIVTDLDGTLTQGGKFTANLLQTFADLSSAKIPLMIVTGRSAGWVSGLVSYLPVLGAIAENGGIYYAAGEPEPVLLSSIPDLGVHRQQLAEVYQHLQSEFPQLQESTDNRFRLTDWTFNNHQLTITQLESLATLCKALGWGFTYSSVHCHIQAASQNKGTSLIKVLDNYFPQYSPEQLVTVGDSPNDASLFNRAVFPLSVGVANILDYANELTYQPAYVTQAAEAEGFFELAQLILSHLG
ncbi:MAG: HAD family phosphatase [Symploca sp. SIO2E6]|nr:HAD family phosphatase [Symploca sp. SIO2E6]